MVSSFLVPSLLQFTMFICCAVIIVIIQYCNFCQLSYWMRSTLASLVGIALLAFLFISPCRYATLQARVQKDIGCKVIEKHTHTAALAE